MTPTQRSLAHLRALGYTPAIVEHWNAFAEIRQDLFGFIDIIALHPKYPGVLGIQTTTAPNMTARLKKIKQLPQHKVWLSSGNRIQVHGWKQAAPRKPWELLIRTVDLSDGS